MYGGVSSWVMHRKDHLDIHVCKFGPGALQPIISLLNYLNELVRHHRASCETLPLASLWWRETILVSRTVPSIT